MPAPVQKLGPIRQLIQGLRTRLGDKDPNVPGIQRTATPTVTTPKGAPPRTTTTSSNLPDYPVKGQPPGGSRTSTTSRVPKPGEYMGSIDAQGNIITPNVGGAADVALPDITKAEGKEVTRANAALGATRAAVGGREGKTEGEITSALGSANLDEARNLAEIKAGRKEAADLPEQVKADISGITDEFKKTSDVDIGKIESLGREAVGMALDGKNAAAQAAVEAQQGSVRNAIAQINSDPNIPQSRKTAMIAQIQTQSSMQIASTIGANIATFTKMQTDAMTSTMQSVGSAMQSRDAIIGQLGGAEINAVASAHEASAGLMKGYDEMSVASRQNAEQVKFQYNTLRQTMRAQKDEVGMQLLADDHYVGGMPTDFGIMNWGMLNGIMESDMRLKFQGKAYQTLAEGIAKGDAGAQQTMLMQAVNQFTSGPTAGILDGLILAFGGGGK